MRVSPELRVAVVGSPAYFKRHGKPKHPRELHQHQCISYRQRSSGAVYRWEFTEQSNDFSIAATGRLLLDDGELMIDAALRGLGLAYVMESSVQRELHDKRLLRVLDSYCLPFPGFFLYYPSRAQLAPKLKALVDFYRVLKAGAR